MDEAVLGQVLAACRAGNLDELLRRRPLATRWYVRRFLSPVLEVAGDVWAHELTPAFAVNLLLRWALARLRPDGQPGLDGLQRADWIERTAWRPLLALACHHGFMPVAEFRDHYRARPDESAADHLCGLWDVAPSSFYRYLDRGRQALADLLREPLQGDRGLSLYAAVQQAAYVRLGLEDRPQRSAWHARQAASAMAALAPRPALWHLLQAGDAPGFIHTLKRFCAELATDPYTDLLIPLFPGTTLDARSRIGLLLAQAALYRVRGADEQERRACEQALRIASAAGNALMLGVVYGALGKFYEQRDTDRAFACYQDSADQLRQGGVQDEASAVEPAVVAAYTDTLVKLAWMYVLRNDASAKAVLERAEAVRAAHPPSDEVAALLEQTWGEYWRRAGELRRALEHKHRALNIYERLGDREALLKTYANLGLIYADAQDFPRAIDYSQRVLAMAEKVAVEPQTVASTHLNLGAAYFWQGRYDHAIAQYEEALARCQAARLRVLAGRAHYNLAEAFYKRFQALEDPADERRGDAHADAALGVWSEGNDPAAAEATRNLKTEMLGARERPTYDRLLSGELAAHFSEMSEVQQQRAVLAAPASLAAQVDAHLGIAQAYVAIAVKEREAALALIDKHGLGDRFAPKVAALRSGFERELTREQRLATAWAQAAADLLRDTAAAAVLRHLLETGAVNKSGYAQLTGLGLATASKQLGMLAERGLLVQTGKGPSTRYLLPG
jgi:tetratricopeptide (TPR) repeat protein